MFLPPRGDGGLCSSMGGDGHRLIWQLPGCQCASAADIPAGTRATIFKAQAASALVAVVLEPETNTQGNLSRWPSHGLVGKFNVNHNGQF